MGLWCFNIITFEAVQKCFQVPRNTRYKMAAIQSYQTMHIAIWGLMVERVMH